uniref:Uncharacterized protein n=1 Tax=Opuntia streptacantha TaxID=393608 RepID=A0A7C9EGW9_OPUST
MPTTSNHRFFCQVQAYVTIKKTSPLIATPLNVLLLINGILLRQVDMILTSLCRFMAPFLSSNTSLSSLQSSNTALTITTRTHTTRVFTDAIRINSQLESIRV